MEINEILDKKLTKEQKTKFQRDNGKLKILKNIVLLPIASAIFGIYLESFPIVAISIIVIILFLISMITFSAMKSEVYDDVIIPNVLSERFSKIEMVKKNSKVEEEYNKSHITDEYDKFESHNCFRIIEDKYYINIAKVITKKVEVTKDDGVVDKHLEDNFKGIFAYVRLPEKFNEEFSVIKNEKTIRQMYSNEITNTQIVKMNNLEFDKTFDVYSMDQVSVKEILSPGVMARILEISNHFGKDMNFSVYNNMLYITISYDKFLDFKGKGKQYVRESIALENLDDLELLNYFVRYFINLTLM